MRASTSVLVLVLACIPFGSAARLRGADLLGYGLRTEPAAPLDEVLIQRSTIDSLADCNSNGVDDTFDIAGGTSEDCNTNSVPDECDLLAYVPLQEAKLTAADAGLFDAFGFRVVISGYTAIIGAPGDNLPGRIGAGSVYVYVQSDGIWTLQAKLTADDAATMDRFGSSVALSDDTAIVGAPYDDHAGGIDAGSAYVFVRSNGVWTQQAKLTAHDAAEYDEFGVSVALSSDMAIVGAWGDDLGGITFVHTDAGSAYVYVRDGGNWIHHTKLITADEQTGDRFGASTVLSGNMAIVGAPYDNHAGGTDAGSVYVFTYSDSDWTQQAKLIADDADSSDRFGVALAISGGTVIIGSHDSEDAGVADAGSAYVYVQSNGIWMQQAKLTADDAAEFAFLGSAVALDGDTAIVGAPAFNQIPLYAGSAYVFVRCGRVWTQHARLAANEMAVGDSFGISVAIASNTVLVGASRADGMGAAFVFDLLPLAHDCNRNRVEDAVDIAGGTSADCNSNGVPDECDLLAHVVSQEAQLAAADADENDLLGFSIALSGDTAIVGAPQDDHGGRVDAGSAYVYVRSESGWTQQTKLTAIDAVAIAWFGNSVALNGDTAIIGAHGDNHAGYGTGAAYVFVRNGGFWSQQAKLTADDAAEEDWFGNSVALSGDAAIIGAWLDDHPGISNAGSAYVFVRSGEVWTQQAKLTASDADAVDFFGCSVALSGDTAVVGAYGDNHTRIDAGSAYVFARSGETWSQQNKLTADDAATGDFFGASVAVFGDMAVVGAYLDDHPGVEDAGSAYVFVRSGVVWTQHAKLTPDDVESGDYFGTSVAIEADTAIVGAPWAERAGSVGAGAAYLYLFSDNFWTQQARLSAAEASALDLFGHSVAISAQTAFAGAVQDDRAGATDAGSAYVFDLQRIAHDCNDNRILDECEFVGGGDFDGNGMVNLVDHMYLMECLGGPGVAPIHERQECLNLCLQAFDNDIDGDVDLIDFAAFTLEFEEPGKSPF